MRVRWRDFELPSRVVLDDHTATPTYGKFIVEPFERGMGMTIGNSLRRVLYSSIEGTAVTGIKIKGVAHEFSTIKGVVEDVMDIILNFKQLLVKMDSESTVQQLSLEANKKGPVRAGQIEVPAGVEIINPELLICTLAEDVEFKANITVARGRRYISAEELRSKERDPEIGFIPIDATFSPVRRVRYTVENTRVGKRTDYDRLILELWTNGVVSPEEALIEASKILRKHLNPFVMYYEASRLLQIDEVKETERQRRERYVEEFRQKLAMSVMDLDFSPRTINCLKLENIETVGELVRKTEEQLMEIKNFGRTSLREVKKVLSGLGLQLGTDLAALLGDKR
jgi:DNA-directed RNA polymerase subunit alpha